MGACGAADGSRYGVGMADDSDVEGSAGVGRSTGVIGSAGVAASAGVVGSSGVTASAGVVGSAGVAGSAGVVGSAGVGFSSAVLVSVAVIGSAGVAGSSAIVAGLGNVGCHACVGCIGCVNCTGCVGCIGCIGLRGAVSTNSGQGYELTVIASAVVGGASLTGGRGTALGALLGALVIKLIENGIVILKLNQEYSSIIVGSAIIVAVAVDHLSEHLRNRRLAGAKQI